MTRTERCACGGRIVAIVGAEELAVRSHQAMSEHRAWRELGGMYPVSGDASRQPFRGRPRMPDSEAMRLLAASASESRRIYNREWMRQFRERQRAAVAAGSA